ncbi:MAG TPA: hypothetical protein PLT65_04350 [Bacilli bacterium]|nr:hypothetical protein [Bacilli bacterium]
MGRLTGFIVLLSGLVLIFNLFGLTSSSSLVNFLLHPETYTSNEIYLAVTVMIGLFLVTGAVSLFVSGSYKIDFISLAPMILLFLAFLNELLAIFNALAVGGAGARIFAVLIMSPMFIMYIMIVIEWWRGVY